jgi:hypothetical protein
MAKTIVNTLQTIPGADIWYFEAGGNHVYLGIVEWKKGNYQFVHAVAPDVKEARYELSKHGELVYMTRLSDVLGELLEKEEE